MDKHLYEPPVSEVLAINADNLVLMVSGNSMDMTVEDKDVVWN